MAGYRVSAGTRLLVNLLRMQRDRPVRSQPEPNDLQAQSGFLTTRRGIDLTGEHLELPAFVCGGRVCSLASFALHALHLTLAQLLHDFELIAPRNKPLDMTESPGL